MPVTITTRSLDGNAFGKRELALGSDPFMGFGDALDAIAGVAGIAVRGRNEKSNFVGTRAEDRSTIGSRSTI